MSAGTIFDGTSGAIFSEDRRYRYLLWRHEPFCSGLKVALWIMLNPSTADENVNDPTVERCERRTLRMPGFGTLVVANIFALRSTNPMALYASTDPVGVDNLRWIKSAAAEADHVVCAWGEHGAFGGADRAALDAIGRERELWCLGVNKSGRPKHPLYVPYRQGLVPFSAVLP